jgi:hypothetical protein
MPRVASLAAGFVFGVAAAVAAPKVAAGAPAGTGGPPLFSDAEILGRPPPYFRLESVALGFAHFNQQGEGYQSRAGPLLGRGSEALTVEQPQLEVVLRQGEHLTHRFWLPVDIVTAASPDAVDVVSAASRSNEAAALDWTATYSSDQKSQLYTRNGFHAEENYRSWNTGLGGAYSFAEDNTVLSASVNETIDWFDQYLTTGKHNGHTSRSATTFSLGVTQLLSPTTLVHLDYGITAQQGQLSNTWNSLPMTDGTRGEEILPSLRRRHAMVARIGQWLPWNGALKGSYRFYGDDWGMVAHTAEVELSQRLAPFSVLRLNYRLHHQTGVDFFTTLAAREANTRTADSDLAELWAQTIGVKSTFTFPVSFARALRVDVGFERYFRSNDLRVSVYSCALAFLF